jgi:hypothetical protein
MHLSFVRLLSVDVNWLRSDLLNLLKSLENFPGSQSDICFVRQSGQM